MPSSDTEPLSGKNAERNQPRRFVVLFHETLASDQRPTHWDLMLEEDSLLATWALDCEPTPTASDSGIACAQLAAHRKQYLDYEGPISQNRGHVTQWDSGTFEWMDRRDGFAAFKLAGEKLQGDYELSEQSRSWVFRRAKADRRPS